MSNAFIEHTRLWIFCCCCFVVFLVVVVVVVDYLDIFLSKLNDKHCAPATKIVCYTASRSIRKGSSITYKDDALLMVMRSQKPQSFCKRDFMGLCTVPIINTSNKTRNQILDNVLVSSRLCFSLCFERVSNSPEGKTVHHLLTSLVLFLTCLVTLAANWTRRWCSLLP